MAAFRACLILCLFALCAADFYIHNPRGSNNKLNEESNNANNANRLFDSQNNNQAGYQVGDSCTPNCQSGGNYNANAVGAGQGKMQYYVGSVLYIEWTQQHACNSENAGDCEIIFQYMCDNNNGVGIRDGSTTTTITTSGLATGADDGVLKYGRHESETFYHDCSVRERNKGLFTADQNMANFATSTRQNNNGNTNRFGYECPEERDYYPYWHPSPWKDIVVFTQTVTRCPYFQRESQNVKAKNHCSNAAFNNVNSCTAGGGQWLETAAWGIAAPDCQPAPWSRDNHHGNGITGAMNSYNWTIPNDVNTNCVLRGRYNISTGDYNGWGDKNGEGFVDAGSNGGLSPVQTDPEKDFLGLNGQVDKLRLNVNTDQYGRVFEDRSHVFAIISPPFEFGIRKVYNVNVRGRRGNNQQVYPAVEYDFAPTVLHLRKNDYIHFQWTGSDANQGGQAGTGQDKTDRSNIVQIASRAVDVPLPYTANTMFVDQSGNPDQAKIGTMAYLNQQTCDPNTANQNDPKNCKVLNGAPAYFNGGLVQIRKMGTMYYMSTRNNNFSNRTQKATIVVHPDLVDYIVAFTIVGAACIAAGVASALLYKKALVHPKYKHCRPRPFPLCCCFHIPRDDEEPGKFRKWWAIHGTTATLLTVYALMNIIIYFWNFITYLDMPQPVPVARGAGAVLDFNCALILLPVLRNIISFIRLTPLAEKIPLDNNIVFHKIIAGVIAAAAIMHIVAHYVDYYNFNIWYGYPIAAQALWTLPGLTGHIILAMFIAIFATAIPERLRRQGFQCGKRTIGSYDTFWLVHQLYIPILVLLWIHAPLFWVWSLWPIALFILEKLIKYYRSHDTTVLHNAEMIGNDVLKVSVAVRGFHHKAGQYVYLACPRLSKYEWHPFTVSSAPESEFVTIHIRVCGDWTRGLKNLLIDNWKNGPKKTAASYSEQEEFLVGPQTNSYSLVPSSTTTGGNHLSEFSEQQESTSTSSSSSEDADSGKEHAMKKKPGGDRAAPVTMPDMSPGEPVDPETILLCDGPYGSSSEYVFNYKTVVLVGTGIGITPFAAIMRSMRVRLGRANCHECKENELNDTRPEELNPHRVYLYWICRDAEQFSWFTTLINDIKDDPTIKRLFDFNTYMTAEVNLDLIRGVTEGGNSSGSGNDETAAKAEKQRNDLLQVKAAGKPNWRRIFGELKGKHKGEDIGVFLCGPPAVADELADAARANSSVRHGETRFSFHKENF